MNSWWSSKQHQWLMPKQHLWCFVNLLTCLLKPNQSESLPYWTKNFFFAVSWALVCTVPISWISSLKSSSFVACLIGFMLKASTFACFSLGLWSILKLKSCSILIHLPRLPCAFDIVTNHSRGLWSVLRVKWFMCRYCLKCMPHINA